MISLKILAIILVIQTRKSEAADATHYRMWGPGLKPDTVILPCRYFFVERVQSDSDNHEDSEDMLKNTKDNLSVTIEGVGDNNRICRPHTEVFDRPAGFLVRYKIFYSCKNIEISVKVNGEHISGSPLKIEDVSNADSCDCPRQTLEDWIVENNCPAPPKQMDDDLKQFEDEGVDMRVALEKAKNTFSHGGSQCWCHYAVKDGEIFRQCYGQHVGFSMFWDNVLNWLARRALLPDLEMLVNLGMFSIRVFINGSVASRKVGLGQVLINLERILD